MPKLSNDRMVSSVTKNEFWKKLSAWFFKASIGVCSIIILCNMLPRSLYIYFPSPSRPINIPFALIILSLVLISALDAEFKERWLGRLKYVLTTTPQFYYFFGFIFGVEIILEVIFLLKPTLYLFGLHRENSLGTLFSAFQLFILGLVVTLLVRREKERPQPKNPVWAWRSLAGLFFYLALDECVSIHEKMGMFFDRFAENGPLNFIHGWLWVFAPFIVGALVILIRFINNQFREEPAIKWVMFSGVACWIMVILLEGIEYKITYGPLREIRFYFLGLEEGSEMLGATLFLLGFSKYMKTQENESAQPSPS